MNNSISLSSAVAVILSLLIVTGQADAQLNVLEMTAQQLADGYANGAFTAVEVTHKHILSGNFGYGASEAASVPEPSTISLVLVSFGFLCVTRSRRRVARH